MAKRKRKAKRLPTKATPVESAKELRKKYPEKLIDAYVNLTKSKELKTDKDFEYYGWTDKAYAKYKKEAIKYLGSKSEEPLESGRLIVLLYKATEDLRDVKNVKEKKTKKKGKAKNSYNQGSGLAGCLRLE